MAERSLSFETELMMPMALLERHVGRREIDMESSDDVIEALAKQYEVSVQAMTVRHSVLARVT